MTKQEIIDQLKNDIYCRLAPSKFGGVGVVAIRDIPAGIDPFKGCNESEYVEISKEDLDGVDPEVLRLFDDLFVFEEGSYYAPDHGLQAVDISYFLNHSKEANMTAAAGGEVFIASRDIKRGEELLVDYNTYDDQTEDDYRK